MSTIIGVVIIETVISTAIETVGGADRVGATAARTRIGADVPTGTRIGITKRTGIGTAARIEAAIGAGNRTTTKIGVGSGGIEIVTGAVNRIIRIGAGNGGTTIRATTGRTAGVTTIAKTTSSAVLSHNSNSRNRNRSRAKTISGRMPVPQDHTVLAMSIHARLRSPIAA